MFDAHCHFHRLPDPWQALFQARAAGVTGFALAGTDPASWEAEAALAQEHPDVVFSIGLHPWWVAGVDDEAVDHGLAELDRRLAEGWPDPAGGDAVRPWAVGEIGLDRTDRVPPEARPRVERAFRAQLELARAHALPVVLHIVRHTGRALELLEAHGEGWRGLVHGMSGSAEVVRRYQRLGLHLSFGPLIHAPHAHRAHEALRATKRSRLLVETDAGGGSPPEAGRPFALAEVLETVAALRDRPLERMVRHTTANGRRLVGLGENPPQLAHGSGGGSGS